jgi:CMD domain protein
LSVENTAGLIFRVSAASKSALGARLAAAFEHAHLLVFRPRDAASSDMKALLAAGWSNTGIVTFSQLVAFLSFQVRVVSGLRTLAAANA